MNHAIVIIEVDKYKNDDYGIWYEYLTYFKHYFENYDAYKNFFIEIGTNHPKGVNAKYLEYMIYYYTTGVTTRKMLEAGYIEECYTDDGDLFYRAVAKPN